MKLVFISIVTTPERSAIAVGARAARRVRHDDVEQRHRHAAVRDAPRVGELVAQLQRDLGLAAARSGAARSRASRRTGCGPGTSMARLRRAMIAETPPSIGSTWPVMCLPACDANSSVAPFRSSSSPMRSSGAWPARLSAPMRAIVPLVILLGNMPGRERVDVDVVLAPFAGERAREVDDRAPCSCCRRPSTCRRCCRPGRRSTRC